MTIDTSVLEDMGLTNAQIKVYIALLELGDSTSGPIIKKSKLQNSVVYNALNGLIEHGLVSFFLKGKRKHFSAADPRNLIKFMEEKKERLQELVPKLTVKQELSKSKQEAKMFLGWKGVKNAFESILEVLPNGSEYIGFAAGFEEQFTPEVRQFFWEFQKKRDRMNYDVKFIVNEAARNQVEKFGFYKEFGKPDFRFVPGFAPLGLIIFGDSVLHVAFEETPVAVIITSKQIADTTRRFFYAMWKIAKK